MRRFPSLPLLAAAVTAVAAFGPASLGAQDARQSASGPVPEIFGTVLDARTGAPIPEMEVVVREAERAGERAGERAAEQGVDRPVVRRTLSDDYGRFRVAVDSAGEYVVSVFRVGYGPPGTNEVTVRVGRDVYLEMRVEPRAIGIQPVRVTVSRRNPFLVRAGFHDREEEGNGYYLTRAEIEAFRGQWPSHIVRRFPEVRGARGDAWVRRCGRRGTRLLINGVSMDREELRLDDIISLDQIAGIEVYTTPETVPAELRRHLTCGVIAIWTLWGDGPGGGP